MLRRQQKILTRIEKLLAIIAFAEVLGDRFGYRHEEDTLNELRNLKMERDGV